MKKTTQKAALLLLLLGGMLCHAQEISGVKEALITARLQLVKGSKTYDPESAIVSYTQLASLGNAEAMNALGMIYFKGIGTEANETLAIEWIEKAAHGGYSRAWYNLALLNKVNEPAKAMKYFEKSALAGYLNAYTDWGRMPLKGEGVPQNYPLAISIFKQGAEKGSAYCQYDLGYLYYKGFGCTQDYNQAIQLFEKAVQKNNARAMYMLGLCYRNGYGVTIDLEKARYWLSRSAALGSKTITKRVSRFRS